MLYVLIVTVWFYGSTGRAPAAQAFTMDSPGQCMAYRGKLLGYESQRSDVRLVHAVCVGFSGAGNSI